MLRRILALSSAIWSMISPMWISPLAIASVWSGAAVAQAQAIGDQIKTVPFKMALATNPLSPIQVNLPPKPDYATDVVAPLRAEQAAEAERARQAALAALAAARKPALVIPTGDVWGALRLCEAGGDYTRNSGNGFYGAYQFDIGTWGNYMGFARADLAPPAVQDSKAQETQARRGWYPWPACSRKLGLI